MVQKTQKAWYMIGKKIVDGFVRYALRADVVRKAVLPRGAKIIVANHPTTSDPAYVTTLVDEQASILIHETLFKVPVFGQSLRMAGHVPVMTSNGKAALEEAIRLLKAGRTVIIFPEGALSPAEGLARAHTGAARLALATGAPVIPVGIGLDRQRIHKMETVVDGKTETSLWCLSGPYAMTLGAPQVYCGDVEDRERVREVTACIMQQIGRLAQESQARVEQQVQAKEKGLLPAFITRQLARIG